MYIVYMNHLSSALITFQVQRTLLGQIVYVLTALRSAHVYASLYVHNYVDNKSFDLHDVDQDL